MDKVRLPHAPLDLELRKKKALKIERLLYLCNMDQPVRLLEIGTGSGGISHYFGTHPSLKCTVSSVDVNDVRVVKEGYSFRKVTGSALPYPDQSFDVIISNHVIEHVGDENEQLLHLSEMARTLKENGTGYIAVPNRWMLMEPHYRVPFLSWLPRRFRTPYLRLTKRGAVYDCEPLTTWQLERLLARSQLVGRNVSVEALHQTLEIERPGSLITRVCGGIPDGLLRLLRPIIPTLIYVVTRADKDGS